MHAVVYNFDSDTIIVISPLQIRESRWCVGNTFSHVPSLRFAKRKPIWERWWFLTHGRQFTVQNSDQLYVLVSSVHKTNYHDMTCKVFKATLNLIYTSSNDSSNIGFMYPLTFTFYLQSIFSTCFSKLPFAK